MNHPRVLLALVALSTLGPVGCGGPNPPGTGDPNPPAPISARYAPRTDLFALTIPAGAPTHWPAANFPPLRSVRLFPHTPDRDLADDLRKQLGKNVLDPLRYEQDVWMPAQADRLARLLDAHFGTPAAPTVLLPDWDTVVATANVRFEPGETFGASLKEARNRLGKFKWDAWKGDHRAASAMRAELKLDDATLARGSLVYRRWCMQCHGPSGAGEASQAVAGGPTPRDYRQGVFKYVTAFPPPALPKKGPGAAGKPRREDLVRTVRNGIEGTIMPAFPTLTPQEVEDVVSYVIHLSVRGEVELACMAKLIKPGDDDPLYVGGEIDWLFVQNELWVLDNWGVAAKNPIPVPPEPFATEPERLKSAVRGFKLYGSAEFGCASCHASYGRVPQLKWDAWGTVVQPRNFTLGVYRGGRRGEDLYARIYGGIYPSGMTAFHDRVAATAPGTPDKIWDIVHFLQALADPADRKRIQELDGEVKIEP
ncbi:MAG: cytochrome c [Planctomycetes bacterium]|nr:cytochrome c [Planctomycetota bacterium]